MANIVSPNAGYSLEQKAPIGAVVLVITLSVLALAGCSLLRQATPTPTPPPVIPTATPEEPASSPTAAPQPTPTSARSILGPAPVSDTTYLHEPFAREQCGACHDLLNKEDPTQLWGGVVEVCRVCHWQKIDGVQPSHIHAPFPEGKCLTCHNPHTSAQAFLLRAPQGQLCRECHDEPDKQPHPPIAPEECLLCHSGHGSEQRAILREPQAQLCARCHADHIQEGAAFQPHAEKARDCTLCHKPHTGEFKFDPNRVAEGCKACHPDVFSAELQVAHKPVEAGFCLRCHDFHQEQQFALLAKPQPDICRNCHEVGKPVEQTHPPIAPGECLLCHSGHGGEHKALLRKPERDMCATCHEDKLVAVGTNVKAHFENENLPLCDSCHNPHNGSQDPVELTASCGQCHTDQIPSISAMRQGSPGIHQPLREEGCVACHEFHGLDAGYPIASTPVNELCMECHATLSHGAHPLSGRPDPWHGGELACDSCHSPHDTPFSDNLLASGDALCLQCHELGR